MLYPSKNHTIVFIFRTCTNFWTNCKVWHLQGHGLERHFVMMSSSQFQHIKLQCKTWKYQWVDLVILMQTEFSKLSKLSNIRMSAVPSIVRWILQPDLIHLAPTGGYVHMGFFLNSNYPARRTNGIDSGPKPSELFLNLFLARRNFCVCVSTKDCLLIFNAFISNGKRIFKTALTWWMTGIASDSYFELGCRSI